MRYGFVLYAGKDRQFEKVEYINDNLDWVKSKIGCEWIEVANLPLFIEKSCLIVDESGLIKSEKPELNYIGSVLYGTPEHGHPIVGNVMLCSQEWNEHGIDLVGFDIDTANEIEKLLLQFQEVREDD